MSNKLKTSTLLFSCFLFSSALWAQQRHCDMSVTLISPQMNQMIAPYETFDVKINIKNLGPDSLLAGDTLLYNLPIFILTDYHVFPFPQNIPPGGNADFTLQSITNVNENVDDEEANFCVIIKSNDSAHTAFVDTAIANNSDCHMVTFGATTSIHGIDNVKNLYSIFPNPVANELGIQWKNQQGEQPQTITIRSIDGRELIQWAPKSNQDKITIPVSKLAAGLYFLDIRTKSGHLVQKFVKQ